jgi:hypothetical protein
MHALPQTAGTKGWRPLVGKETHDLNSRVTTHTLRMIVTSFGHVGIP